LRTVLEEECRPLHAEIRNHLSLVTRGSDGESAKKSLADIEKEVLHELVGANSRYKDRQDELVALSLAMRDLVLKGEVSDEELLGILAQKDDASAGG
jgi:hypothetical protein